MKYQANLIQITTLNADEVDKLNIKIDQLSNLQSLLILRISRHCHHASDRRSGLLIAI